MRAIRFYSISLNIVNDFMKILGGKLYRGEHGDICEDVETGAVCLSCGENNFKYRGDKIECGTCKNVPCYSLGYKLLK